MTTYSRSLELVYRILRGRRLLRRWLCPVIQMLGSLRPRLSCLRLNRTITSRLREEGRESLWKRRLKKTLFSRSLISWYEGISSTRWFKSKWKQKSIIWSIRQNRFMSMKKRKYLINIASLILEKNVSTVN